MLISLSLMALDPVTVIILDDTNEPLTGVKFTDVSEKITHYSNFDGVVSISDVSEAKTYLVEMNGYQSETVSIDPKAGIQTIKIVLKAEGLQ
jgi:hypothetical protein